MRILITLLALLTLPASIVSAQDTAYRQIEEGLEYAEIKLEEGPQKIHVLKVKRNHAGWRWTTGLGDGRVYGLSTTPAIAKASAAALNGRLVAAINGDFFAIARGNYQGDPVGLHVMEGELISAPANRGCVWFDAAGQPKMGVVESRLRVVWPDGATETPIGFNERRSDDRAVLYTPAMATYPKELSNYDFGTRTTDGRELILDPVDEMTPFRLQVGQTFRATVISRREGGNSPISKKSVILSIGPKLLPSVPVLNVGDTLTIKLETAPDLTGAVNAIGGGERLLAHGQIATNGKSKDRHPRSIIGWNDEILLLIVVDGRTKNIAAGMTYLELANLAKDLNCTEALNLDGGGSSTLWADGKILNTPSDGAARPVANALVLVEVK